MQLSTFTYLFMSLATFTKASPIEKREDITPFQIVMLAPCKSDCIVEGKDKLVVTQADCETCNKSSTTINDFQTASDDKARRYRPVAVTKFHEGSALPKLVWFTPEQFGVPAKCSIYLDQFPEPDKDGVTWELLDWVNKLKDGGAVQRLGPLGISCVVDPDSDNAGV